MESILKSPNHLALRTDDADAMAEVLKKQNVTLECEPFTAPMKFKQPLHTGDLDVFKKTSQAGTQVRIFFFRGPNNERIEIMADNVGSL
jgi:hypothetical protein